MHLTQSSDEAQIEFTTNDHGSSTLLEPWGCARRMVGQGAVARAAVQSAGSKIGAGRVRARGSDAGKDVRSGWWIEIGCDDRL